MDYVTLELCEDLQLVHERKYSSVCATLPRSVFPTVFSQCNKTQLFQFSTEYRSKMLRPEHTVNQIVHFDFIVLGQRMSGTRIGTRIVFGRQQSDQRAAA